MESEIWKERHDNIFDSRGGSTVLETDNEGNKWKAVTGGQPRYFKTIWQAMNHCEETEHRIKLRNKWTSDKLTSQEGIKQSTTREYRDFVKKYLKKNPNPTKEVFRDNDSIESCRWFTVSKPIIMIPLYGTDSFNIILAEGGRLIKPRDKNGYENKSGGFGHVAVMDSVNMEIVCGWLTLYKSTLTDLFIDDFVISKKLIKELELIKGTEKIVAKIKSHSFFPHIKEEL